MCHRPGHHQGPQVKLATALDQYAHAIACAADSITIAAAFADLTAANRAYVDRQAAIETMTCDRATV